MRTDTIQHQVAVVVSRFHHLITDRLRQSALGTLDAGGYGEGEVTVVDVPGAFELPLMAQCLAQTGLYEGILCLGCVIRGETDHYDHICRVVADGIGRVSLENRLPVIFGVITAGNRAQAEDRAGGKKDLGRQGAEALLDMICRCHAVCAPR